MKKGLVFWVESYFYNPSFFQKIISFCLLPLSYVYCFIVWIRFRLQKPQDFGIKIISIGNLSVGGSGKTPLGVAVGSYMDDVCVILRGYGRDSRGLHVISDGKKILCDVSISGDEAMIYAKKLPHAIVIVSENRVEAIKKAKEMGAKTIILDDGYSKHNIKKTDILIEVKTKNNRCLPSGAFRERLWSGKNALVVKDGVDFKRVVDIKNPTQKMSLATAIARPQRLDEYLPDVVGKHYFEDHHSWTKDELLEILEKDKSDSLLVTYKDFVKIERFDLPISLLDLHVEIDEKLLNILKQL